MTAIDLKTGEHTWMVPMGDGPRMHPALRELALDRLGWPYRGFPLVTKTLLLVAQTGAFANVRRDMTSFLADLETVDPALQAYDKGTGELIAKVPLPINAQGSPMTYTIGGKQYIVVAVGGLNLPAELIALALP
jgi:quinoprotein glucose dehydrogenase